MAHPSDQSNPFCQGLNQMDDMHYELIGMPSQRHSKEIVPPPVDPFGSSSGMYIPPDEFKQNEPSLEEIMGWSLSDDQQDTEEDDDDMDDNEFDLDFEDADYPPPIRPEDQTPGLCQRHMSHPKFNDLQYMPYVPSHSTVAQYPALISRENIEQTMGFDPVDAAPVQFINPSSLHLPFQWPYESMENSSFKSPLESTNGQANGNTQSFSSYPPNTHASYPDSAPPSSPKILTGDDGFASTVDSSQSSSHLHSSDGTDISSPGLELGTDDIEIGMDMGDLYPPTPENSIEQFEKNDILSSPADEPQRAQDNTHATDTSAVSPVASSPANSPSEATGSSLPLVSERLNSHPKRKITRKKATFSHRPTASSSSHLTAHVCNMTYSDGSECHRSFTRPYDLARHQETLHAAVRKMYTCEVCGAHSKTFSRLDALSRHMRLKH